MDFHPIQLILLDGLVEGFVSNSVHFGTCLLSESHPWLNTTVEQCSASRVKGLGPQIGITLACVVMVDVEAVAFIESDTGDDPTEISGCCLVQLAHNRQCLLHRMRRLCLMGLLNA